MYILYIFFLFCIYYKYIYIYYIYHIIFIYIYIYIHNCTYTIIYIHIYIYIYSYITIRRKFRNQTSDSMERLKSRDGKSQRREEKRREEEEERRSEKRKSERKEDAGARKGRKVAKHCVFPMICGSGGSKSSLAKAAGAEPSGQMRDDKLHAVAARSTCPSQNAQNAPTSDHSWKSRCWNKCTPLWREAHFQINMYKTPVSEHFRKLRWRKSGRRCGKKHTPGSEHFLKLRCRKSARRCGAKHISKSKC